MVERRSEVERSTYAFIIDEGTMFLDGVDGEKKLVQVWASNSTVLSFNRPI